MVLWLFGHTDGIAISTGQFMAGMVLLREFLLLFASDRRSRPIYQCIRPCPKRVFCICALVNGLRRLHLCSVGSVNACINA